MKVVFLFFVFLTGCKVGPNYYPVEAPMPSQYSEDQEDKTTPVDDQDLVEWWKIFNDPFLEQLLYESIAGNFDYKIAIQQIIQARAQFWMQFKQALPEIDADAQASHFRVSQSFNTNAQAPLTTPTATTASLSPIQNFFQVGFDAIWEIDLFGGLSRAKDAAFHTWEATSDAADFVKITVLSEVASTYTAIAALQKKLEIASHIVDLDENLLALAKEKFDAGLASLQEVEAFIATLEQDKSNLYQSIATLKVTIYSLATLLGRQPETLLQDFVESRPIPSSSQKIPAGLPGDLLRRRPDIRSSERNLAATTDQIGVAVAELFPKISLTGSTSSFAANPLQGANIGFSSPVARTLFNHSSLIWGMGAIVSFPVFDFGKRQDGVTIAYSIQSQAYLSYQKTVISALQEVEQALASYFAEEQKEAALSKAAKSYERTFILVEDLYQAGLADFFQVLQVRQSWLNSINALTDSQQALTTDLIAVYKALGGDWLCWL